MTIRASDEKSRRGAVLPLPRDVAGALAQWLRTRQADPEAALSHHGLTERLLWPGTWTNKAAEMLRHDLDDAGIPYADNDGCVFNFHSLRSQYINDLARSGVPLATAQKLARHSDPRLTARNDTHLQLIDLDSAVQQLQATLPAAMQATGTDDSDSHVVAGLSGNHSDSLRAIETRKGQQPADDDRGFTPQLQGVASD